MGNPSIKATDGSLWITSRHIVALLVSITVLCIAYLTSRKNRRWIRGLFKAELPGGIATVIALVIAVQPTVAMGKYQGVFIVAALVCLVWFIFVYFRNVYQEGKAEALRFAWEALSLSNKLYNSIRDAKSIESIIANPLDRRVLEARFRATEIYANSYRLEVPYFLENMAKKDIWEDKEALALTASMEAATVEQIEELAAMLNSISNDIVKYEG